MGLLILYKTWYNWAMHSYEKTGPRSYRRVSG
jgi:hypothetical protein